MEEKEKKLRELMDGCEGKTIYSVVEGNVRFDGFEENGFKIHINRDDEEKDIVVYSPFFPSGECMFFPSEEYYKLAPRDGIKSWELFNYEQNFKYTVKVTIDTFIERKEGRRKSHTTNEEFVKDLSLKNRDECVNDILRTLSAYQLPF